MSERHVTSSTMSSACNYADDGEGGTYEDVADDVDMHDSEGYITPKSNYVEVVEEVSKHESKKYTVADSLKSWWYRHLRQFLWFMHVLFVRVDTGGFRYKYPARMLPVVNFFYDLFFASNTITPESSKSLLDILGLLNALVLSGLFGLMASVTFEDTSKADELWWGITAKNGMIGGIPLNITDYLAVKRATGQYKFKADYPSASNYQVYWHKYYDNPPSAQLYIWLSNALTLMCMALLCIVYIYADSVAKVKELNVPQYLDKTYNAKLDEEKREAEKGKKKEHQLLYQTWWAWAKYGTVVCIFLSCIGVIYTVLACQVLMAIKYPG